MASDLDIQELLAQSCASMCTLNLIPVLGFGGSNEFIWHEVFSGFWNCLTTLEANNCRSWQLHDDRSWMETEGKGSLFFSRKPLVSYRTLKKTQNVNEIITHNENHNHLYKCKGPQTCINLYRPLKTLSFSVASMLCYFYPTVG